MGPLVPPQPSIRSRFGWSTTASIRFLIGHLIALLEGLRVGLTTDGCNVLRAQVFPLGRPPASEGVPDPPRQGIETRQFLRPSEPVARNLDLYRFGRIVGAVGSGESFLVRVDSSRR
jgi:hypothetical protein